MAKSAKFLMINLDFQFICNLYAASMLQEFYVFVNASSKLQASSLQDLLPGEERLVLYLFSLPLKCFLVSRNNRISLVSFSYVPMKLKKTCHGSLISGMKTEISRAVVYKPHRQGLPPLRPQDGLEEWGRGARQLSE